MTKPIGTHNYFVYILTNKSKTTLYIGVTNNLKTRLHQHLNNELNNSYTSRYKCYFLIYFERFSNIELAIAREKQLKKWNRNKKEDLIKEFNPNWEFLNETIG